MPRGEVNNREVIRLPRVENAAGKERVKPAVKGSAAYVACMG